MSAFSNPSQRAAIEAGGNVLVSAGAGTGKTTTLVARALRLVFEKSCDLDRILMVTFTDAAAAEMRQRLREELEKLHTAEEAAKSERAAEQLALLDTAPIGTLHGFCLQLVRQHFHDLDGVDPQVAVLDASQTRPLEAAALETVLERHYTRASEASERVREFIRCECRGSDDQVRALILRLHRYAQTSPDPADWIQKQLESLKEADPVHWRHWLVEAFQEWRAFWLPRFRAAQTGQPCYATFTNALVEVSNPPTTEKMRAALKAIGEANQTKGGVWPAKKALQLRAPFKKFFGEAEEFQSLALPEDGSDPLAEDWRHVRGPMSVLLTLAGEFTAEFSRAKRELAGVDFADIEQFTLRLLRQPQIGERWRAQFEHVFVDECQDINAAQDEILRLLSGEGAKANRFLVGDLKQSVYRFRLADPRIFRRYEHEWSGEAGQCLRLSDNFRSREGVLKFINRLFAALMRPVFGGMDYPEATHLRFGRGATHPELSLKNDVDGHPRVELHLIQQTEMHSTADKNDSDDGNSGRLASEVFDLEKTEKEARLVAQRLIQLRAEKRMVWNGKTLKTVDWGDMVVLMRSVKAKSETYAKVFHEFGIPLVARRGGFYGALEVMDLLNLLRLLDNPLQDVPLLAVLRSPLVGLSLDELAAIRATLSRAPFWEALRKFHRETAHDHSAWPKVDEFLTRHARWRSGVQRGSLSACLESALDETGYEALLLAGARGTARAGNVRQLLALARRFDPHQRQGLHRFLRFIDQQLELEEDREPAPPTEMTGAVELRTIHQSKGLEFPVVVLAGIGQSFNEQDLRKDILISQRYEFCMKVLAPEAEQRYPSLPFSLAKRHEEAELRAEELRLLYVAMTRARDTLLLVGTDTSRPLDKDGNLKIQTLDDVTLLEQRSYLGWLKLWLPELVKAQAGVARREDRNDLVSWAIYTADDERLAVTPVLPAKAPAALSDAAVENAALNVLRERFAWRYSDEAATETAAKASVTALRRRLREAEDEEVAQQFRAPRFRFTENEVTTGNKLSPAEIGTAHHTFQQFVALDRTGSVGELRAEADRLRGADVFTPAEREVLDLNALATFWDSKVGRQIRAEKGATRRELPFTARFGLEELTALGLPAGGGAADDFVVVQGVADLVVMLSEEIWLLDFKTDRMDRATSAELEEKKAYYAPQLKLYAAALEKIYRRPVTRRWLHFFDVGETTSV